MKQTYCAFKRKSNSKRQSETIRWRQLEMKYSECSKDTKKLIILDHWIYCFNCKRKIIYLSSRCPIDCTHFVVSPKLALGSCLLLKNWLVSLIILDLDQVLSFCLFSGVLPCCMAHCKEGNWANRQITILFLSI